MKKFKLSLFALPFLGLLFAGCDKLPDQPEEEAPQGEQSTSEGGSESGGGSQESTTQETEIQKVVRIAKQDFFAENVSYTIHSTSNTPYGDSSMEETFERDGNKVHVSLTSTSSGMIQPQSSEYYYVQDGDKGYVYNKNGGETWTVMETPRKMALDSSGSIYGMDACFAKFAETATKQDDGSWKATNLTYTIRSEDLINQIGYDYSGYTIAKETIDFTLEYLIIKVENDHLSYFEQKNCSIRFDYDDDEMTITPVLDETYVCVSTLSNFRNFGTTVVTLPEAQPMEIH